MGKKLVIEKGIEATEIKERYFQECGKNGIPFIVIEKLEGEGYTLTFDWSSYGSNELLPYLQRNRKEIRENIIGTLDLTGYFTLARIHSVGAERCRITELSLPTAEYLADEIHCIYKPYYDKVNEELGVS